jgi:lambda repressor-like predicted transcriptional regulator
MEKIYLTKSNSIMNLTTRSNIIDIMTTVENDGLTKAQIAQKADISISTLNNYLTTGTWQDIRKLRLAIVSETLSKVDQAIFAKAINGDLAAAKLVYSRWDEQQENIKDLENNDETKSIRQIEDEIKSIKQQIKQYSN